MLVEPSYLTYQRLTDNESDHQNLEILKHCRILEEGPGKGFIVICGPIPISVIIVSIKAICEREIVFSSICLILTQT